MIMLDPFVLDARQAEDIFPGLRNKTSRQRMKLNTTIFAPVSFFLTLLLLAVSFDFLSKGKGKIEKGNQRAVHSYSIKSFKKSLS